MRNWEHFYIMFYACNCYECGDVTAPAQCLFTRRNFPIQERRGSFDRRNSTDRRSSTEPDNPIQVKQLDVEQLEVQQKQRRNSMQMRRTSLAEVIPDWPLLQKRKAPEKVYARTTRHAHALSFGTRTTVAESAGVCRPPFFVSFVLGVLVSS